MAAKQINDRWQREMKELFEDPEQRPADRQMAPLEEVFHLDGRLVEPYAPGFAK